MTASRTPAPPGSPGAPAPPARRSRARRGEGDRLREEILQAAERMLIDTGDESALSIRRIADAVGVTPPSIYLHFADRNDLLFAVCEEQFRHLDEAMEAAVTGVVEPLARLRARGRAYIDFGLSNPEHYRILMMGRPDTTPDRFVDERLSDTAAFGHVADDVALAIEAGQLRPGDATLVACGLWITVHGLTSLLITKPGFPWPDREALIDHVLTVVVAGLTATGGPPR